MSLTDELLGKKSPSKGLTSSAPTIDLKGNKYFKYPEPEKKSPSLSDQIFSFSQGLLKQAAHNVQNPNFGITPSNDPILKKYPKGISKDTPLADRKAYINASAESGTGLGMNLIGATSGIEKYKAGRGFLETLFALGKNQKGKLASEAVEAIPVKQEIDPVKKIIKALKEAKPLRGEQEALYTQARSQKLAKMMSVRGATSGEKGFYSELGSLKGELPKIKYESIRPKFEQADIDQLFNLVKDAKVIGEWDKISAREGLVKMFTKEGTAVPTEGELKLLNKVFGNEFTEAVLSKRTGWQKLLNGLGEVINLPRSLMSSFDLSAPFRQGIFLTTHPKRFGQSFIKMFNQAGSDKAFKAVQEEIASRPTYKLMQENKLALSDIDRFLSTREEAFMSSWAERIPVVGKVVRASNRAYTGFLNKLRADVFDDLVKNGQKLGLGDDPKFLDSVANYVNTATGRGSIGSFQRIAPVLNGLFFSPKLMASRLNLMNPKFYADLHPQVRKQALKDLLTFASTAMTVFGLAKAGGADVGLDPRSADFGKIKIGNTRYDTLGGFQQYIRFAAQMLTGETVSSTTGQLNYLGEGYKPQSRYDILLNFFGNKEAPIASLVTDFLKGKDFSGEKFNLSKAITDRLVPMVSQDFIDAYKEWGNEGIGMSVPAIFGFSSQTYKAGEDTPFGLYEKLSKLPKDEANREAEKVRETDPQLYGNLKRLIAQKKAGINQREEALSNYGVENGDRAKKIWEMLSKLKTAEEKNALVEKLQAGRIITDDVFEQLKELKTKGYSQPQGYQQLFQMLGVNQ